MMKFHPIILSINSFHKSSSLWQTSIVLRKWCKGRICFKWKILERPLNNLKTTRNTSKDAIETENDKVPDIATIHVNKETIAYENVSIGLLTVAFKLLQISQDSSVDFSYHLSLVFCSNSVHQIDPFSSHERIFFKFRHFHHSEFSSQ